MGFFKKEWLTDKLTFAVILLVIVAAIFVFTSKDEKAEITLNNEAEAVTAVPADSSGVNGLEKGIEEKIAVNLEKMKGVGKTKVLVTLTSGMKKEYARDESVTKRTSKETDKEGGTRETVEITESNRIIIAGNANPLIVVEEKPQIGGVLVIAQGANDPKVKEQIFEAVKTLLNIPPSKISVVPMGGE